MEYLTDQDYETALKNGISKRNVYNRVYNCYWSKERAITQPVNAPSLWDKWKNKSVVGMNTFYWRVWKGWKEEEAAAIPKLEPHERREHVAVLTAEHLAVAESNGIKRNTAKQRVYQYRWPVEKAITLPVGTRKHNHFNTFIGGN